MTDRHFRRRSRRLMSKRNEGRVQRPPVERNARAARHQRIQLVKLRKGRRRAEDVEAAGTFVTPARDVVEMVGPDVTRFVNVTRKKRRRTLDFDVDKVREQSKDTPSSTCNYAHARIQSVMRKRPSGASCPRRGRMTSRSRPDPAELALGGPSSPEWPAPRRKCRNRARAAPGGFYL